jgi:hypothetical protein
MEGIVPASRFLGIGGFMKKGTAVSDLSCAEGLWTAVDDGFDRSRHVPSDDPAPGRMPILACAVGYIG